MTVQRSPVNNEILAFDSLVHWLDLDYSTLLKENKGVSTFDVSF